MLIAKVGSLLSYMKRNLNFFLIKFNCLLFTFFTVSSELLPVICLFWQTLTAWDDTRTRQHMRQGSKKFAPKWPHLIRFFFAGETSRVLALLLAFTAENINNLPLALHTCAKNWAQPCRQVYISKNISRLNQVKQFRTVHSPSQVQRFFGIGFFFF